ncbi:MAG: YraN family protein [Clostridia bacterium]|nr:YraN family protein [Clostridia bacterium]
MATRLLRRRGYKILENNYTALDSEIDIIARKRNITAFIEVKTRNVKSLGKAESRPGSSVTPEKQRKIIKVANYYSAHHPSDTRLRLDVIEVYLEGEGKNVKVRDIKHIEGAFNKNTAFDGYHLKKDL